MDMNLKGAIVVVTGGASGIGRASVGAFADEGARLAILDRNATAAQEVAGELARRDVQALAVTADVTDDDSVRLAMSEVADRFGGIDVLACCAGVSGPYGRTIEEIETAEWDDVMAVNVRGRWLPVKRALPFLRKSDRAAVVIVASDSALVASPLHVPYCTSKGAAVMLTRALSVDLAQDGVRVNCVCPSVVDTPMARQDLGLELAGFKDVGYPVQDPIQIARYMVFLGSTISASINGQALVADFGYTARSVFPA